MEEPDLAHFQSIPWCSKLLRNPAFAITPTFSRQPKESTEDSIIAETLNTENTITRCLSIYRIPPPGTTWISEFYTLMTLGTGMNGGALKLHGGIIATLMDDVVGLLLTINKGSDKLPLSNSTVTANFTVKYLKPVVTPGTVLVVAKCREVKGRKYYMDSEIRGSQGEVLASSESLWIGLRRDQKL